MGQRHTEGEQCPWETSKAYTCNLGHVQKRNAGRLAKCQGREQRSRHARPRGLLRLLENEALLGFTIPLFYLRGAED